MLNFRLRPSHSESQPMTIREQLQAWQPAQRSNPLPEPFEQQAFKVFAQRLDMASWADPLFKAERDAARKIVRDNALETMDQMAWTLDTAAGLLAEQSIGLLFGQREVGPTARGQVLDYAESYLEDLWPVFGHPFMSPGGQAKNAADLRLTKARVQ